MTAKKAPAKTRKPRTISVPKALKIEVCVSRGDFWAKCETTAEHVGDVSRFLIATVRELAAEAPDILPHVETVPGDVLGYDWAEEYEGSAKVGVKKVGFR